MQDEKISLVSNERVDAVCCTISSSFRSIKALLSSSDTRYDRAANCLEAAEMVGWGNSGEKYYFNVAKTEVMKCELQLNAAIRKLDSSSLDSVFFCYGKNYLQQLIAFDQSSASYLGCGLQGSVFAFANRNDGQVCSDICAIKVIRNPNPDAVDHELRFLCLPRHTNVAALQGARVDRVVSRGPASEVEVMFSYELATMGSVEEILRASGAMVESTVRSWVVQTLRGLQHLHCVANVAHLDIKPGNLLLYGGAASTPAGCDLRICDFGSCETMGTKCLHTRGTPLYMSPTHVSAARPPALTSQPLSVEFIAALSRTTARSDWTGCIVVWQARGNFIVDHRPDVWSLAVTAIEALTGAHPLALPSPDPRLEPSPEPESAPAQLFRVGCLPGAPRHDLALADAGLRAFLDGALAVTPATRAGMVGLVDAVGMSPRALLARMGSS